MAQALNKNAGASFTPADEKSLRLISQHLGNTLAKARLHEVAKREKARLSALYKTFKALNAAVRRLCAAATWSWCCCSLGARHHSR